MDKLEKFSRIFKNTLVERVFEKMVSNLSILEGIFEAKFQSWFFFRKNFKGISLIKFTTFLKIKKISRDFFCKIEDNFFKGISHVKLKVSSIFWGWFLKKNYNRFPRKKWGKFFNGDFHVKLEVSFKFFTRDFHVNWRCLIFGGLFFSLSKKNFLYNGLRSIETGIECWAIPAIDLLPPYLWSEKWRSDPLLVLWFFSI